MEFNRTFAVVQGALNSFQKSSGVKLADISEDYPEELDRLVELLRNTIKGNAWDKPSQRKIHLFLVLNTDFQHVSLLDEDPNLRHLIGTTPELSTFLYLQLVTRLDWHEFVAEVVHHCPEVLVHDILVGFERFLKHIRPDAAVPFFYSLYDSLFHKIALLQDVCKHRSLAFVKLFKSLAKYKFKEVVKSLKCSSEESKYYFGFVYRMYLKLVKSCIDRLQRQPVVKEEIYAFKIHYDYTIWPESSQTNWTYHCLGDVTSAALELSEDVDVDTYMSWTEVNCPEDPSKTLQLAVREAAYNTLMSIASISGLKDSVLGLSSLESRLKCIAVEPTTEDEEIAKADLDTLTTRLMDPKRNQVKWLNALIERDIFNDGNILNVIKNNRKVATVDTVLSLLDRAALFMKDNPQKPWDSIKEICRSYVQGLTRHDLDFLLKKYFERNYSDNPFVSDSFERKIVALFNNLSRETVKDDKVVNDSAWLAIENCDGLVKACICGSLESKRKAEIIVDLLKEIRPVTDAASAAGEPLVVTHLLKQNPSTPDGLLYLVELLCKNKLVNPQKFILSHVIPKLAESVPGNLTAVILNLDILIITEPYVAIQSAHHVAFLAKILNKVRPRIHSFNRDACEATTRCITLLTAAVDRFKNKSMQDNEVTWLRSLGERLSPLTRVYLDPLWALCGNAPPTSDVKAWNKKGFGFDEGLLDLDGKNRATLVTYLVKTVPLLTSTEWQNIAGGQEEIDDRLSHAVFMILADCILVLFQVPFNVSDEKLAQSSSIKSCLTYSFANFLSLIKFAYIRRIPKWTDGQIVSARDKLDQISSSLPAGVDGANLLQNVGVHFSSRHTNS